MKGNTFSDIIRRAAHKLFLEKGINNVSTRDVTKKLNLSRSHIYHYYSDWNSLKIDVLTHMLGDDIEEYITTVEKVHFATPSDELIYYINYLLPDKPSSHWLLYLELWPLSAREPQYADLIHRHSMRWNAIIETIISRGIERGAFLISEKSIAARQISALIDGYSSMIILDYSAEKRAGFLEEISKLSFEIVKINPGLILV